MIQVKRLRRIGGIIFGLPLLQHENDMLLQNILFAFKISIQRYSAHLMGLEVIVAPKLRVTSSHGVGGFQQVVVVKVTVSGFNHSCILSFKVTGLVLCPYKTGVLGNRCLGLKAVDIADLGDDTGRVNRTDTGMDVSVLGMIWNCCSMAFSSTLIWLSRARIVAMDTDMTWLTELLTVLGSL